MPNGARHFLAYRLDSTRLGAICCQPCRPRNTWDTTLQNFCRYQHLATGGPWRGMRTVHISFLFHACAQPAIFWRTGSTRLDLAQYAANLVVLETPGTLRYRTFAGISIWATGGPWHGMRTGEQIWYHSSCSFAPNHEQNHLQGINVYIAFFFPAVPFTGCLRADRLHLSVHMIIVLYKTRGDKWYWYDVYIEYRILGQNCIWQHAKYTTLPDLTKRNQKRCVNSWNTLCRWSWCFGYFCFWDVHSFGKAWKRSRMTTLYTYPRHVHFFISFQSLASVTHRHGTQALHWRCAKQKRSRHDFPSWKTKPHQGQHPRPQRLQVCTPWAPRNSLGVLGVAAVQQSGAEGIDQKTRTAASHQWKAELQSFQKTRTGDKSGCLKFLGGRFAPTQSCLRSCSHKSAGCWGFFWNILLEKHWVFSGRLCWAMLCANNRTISKVRKFQKFGSSLP